MAEYSVQNLDELLTKYYGQPVKILETKSKMLTAPGENYGSLMLALDVTIALRKDQKQLHLVAKLLPKSEFMRGLFDIFVTFKKEIDAYTKAIPALIEFQRDYGVDNVIDFFGECYGARCSLSNTEKIDEDAVILLENLKYEGYDNIDRLVGFNFEEAELILKDLAMFHAVPIAFKALKPKEFEKKIGPAIIRHRGIEYAHPSMIESIYDCLRDHLKIAGFEHLTEKILNILRNTLHSEQKNKVPPNTPFLTWIHFDYWVNNTMLLHDKTGKPIKNKMVDLQMIRYDSCTRDLLFVLFTSIKTEVVKSRYDELIKIYYDSFIKSLEVFKIDLEPYSWVNFLKEIDAYAAYELEHILFMLKPIFTIKGSIESMDNLDDNDMNRQDLIGEAFTNKLKDTIEAYTQRNWL
ncbi:PREDICTED: uncharacterized protein LOC108560921 [Nicrophorus vespilloides]|uniref:Uncharacterized protein LOC108560921 n=1 Tax=Nicrophorus vespilloides TaxID=110193 RepID=A0ABM1MHT0_NICVS|nr:PREDICTED: uncharacterized protein LOC108560921 [Nicrophorus vespilloides]